MAGVLEDIRKVLLESGAALVGFADMKAVPVEDRRGMERAISIAVALNPEIVSRITKGPTQEYFREYRRANDLLSKLSQLAARLIAERGFEALAIEPTRRSILMRLSFERGFPTRSPQRDRGWAGSERMPL